MLSISLQTSILLLIIFLHSPLCGSTGWWVSCSKERFYHFRLCLLTVRLVLTINLATVCRIRSVSIRSDIDNFTDFWSSPAALKFDPQLWRKIEKKLWKKKLWSFFKFFSMFTLINLMIYRLFLNFRIPLMLFKII